MRFLRFLTQSPDGLLHTVLDDTIADMTAAVTVMDSAVIFINGVPALVQTAVDAAIANGATAEQLAPLTDLNAQLVEKSQALQTALEPPAAGGMSSGSSARSRG